MELRPVQTALLAGRAASRWATSTATTASWTPVPLSICSSAFSRTFSSTRRALQEAEATAPLPGGGMAGYVRRQRTQQQEAQQKQQQQQQQQQNKQQEKGRPPQINSIFSTPNNSPSDLRSPWASRPSNAQVVPASARSLLHDLGDLGLADQIRPELTDMERQMQGAYYERPIDVKYRLRPVIGRTIELTTAGSAANGASVRNIDFAKALVRLDMQVRINRVRADLNAQRFHERPGLKRKRLLRERWVRRFKDGFKANCKRVTELAKQGW